MLFFSSCDFSIFLFLSVLISGTHCAPGLGIALGEGTGRTAFTGRAGVGEEEGEKGFIENICLLLL